MNSTEELFRENERRTNRRASFALCCIGVLYVVLAALGEFGVYNLVSRTAVLLMLLTGLLNVAVSAAAAGMRFGDSRIKWMILGAVMLCSGVVYFYFPLNATFLLYGPVMIAAMYYQPGLVRRLAPVNLLLLSALLWANVLLEKYSASMQEIHAIQGITVWQFPDEVLLNRQVPIAAFFLIAVYIGESIARRGREMVLKQSEMTSELNRMETELRLAANIQQSSLPEPVFRTPEGTLSVCACMQPARTVGGDFYDYYVLGNHLVFLVADVSDKGLSAAMFMMKAKNAIRLAVESGKPMEQALEDVNRLLCRDNGDNLFVTLWIASVDVRTGYGKYVNCGHPYPVRRETGRDGGSVTYLGTETEPIPMLGVFEEMKIAAHPFRLGEGEALLLYTDGLTDALNPAGESFGEERLNQALKNIPMSFEEENPVSALMESVRVFTGTADRTDDITALAVQLRSAACPATGELTLKAEPGAALLLEDAADALLKKLRCPDDARRSILVAADEICTNAVDYAYPEGDGEIRASLKAGENYFEMTVTDRGVAFNPLSESAENDGAFCDPGEELKIGGLGILLTKSLMDAVDYSRVSGENRLHVLKIWD